MVLYSVDILLQGVKGCYTGTWCYSMLRLCYRPFSNAGCYGVKQWYMVLHGFDTVLQGVAGWYRASHGSTEWCYTVLQGVTWCYTDLT